MIDAWRIDIKNLEKIRQNNLLLSDKPEYVKNSDLAIEEVLTQTKFEDIEI